MRLSAALSSLPVPDHVATAQPGHPLYIDPVQGHGRWDNPSLSLCRYLATSPEAAIGESFGNFATWSAAMLVVPGPVGSERHLDVCRTSKEANALLDLGAHPRASG